jgi:hypothetical protein
VIRASEAYFAIGDAAGLTGESASARCVADIISTAAAAMPSDCARRRPRFGIFIMRETLPGNCVQRAADSAGANPHAHRIIGQIVTWSVLSNFGARLESPI